MGWASRPSAGWTRFDRQAADPTHEDYADETVLLNTNTIDDTWDAGYVGLFRGQGSSSTQQFDDVKVGFDNNGDDDIADAGDQRGEGSRLAKALLTSRHGEQAT